MENQFSSVAQSCLTLCDPMDCSTQGFPFHQLLEGACSNSCPSSQWCHPTILSSVIPFSCPQSFPASGSFQMSQLFTSGGQSIGISASTSVLSMDTQDWSPLGWSIPEVIAISPPNLIPLCASFSPVFLMIYFAYKLNKQGDNIQPWCTPFPIWNQI